jgi:hypothetical protein
LADSGSCWEKNLEHPETADGAARQIDAYIATGKAAGPMPAHPNGHHALHPIRPPPLR